MIVVLDNSGRLCNRLVLFAHACATAIESKQTISHLIADDVVSYAKLDCLTLKKYNVSCRLGIWGLAFLLRCRQAFHERVRPIDIEKYKAGNTDRSEKMIAMPSRLHIVSCWYYRNPKALMRQRDKICSILAPKDEFVKRARIFANEIRSHVLGLVGVHVRRGDYREFCEGRYFFSNEQYVRFMKMAQQVLPDGYRFVLVSDEPLDEGFFRQNGLDAYVFHGEDFREDLVMLSLCEYVMGPWSTFSWWAAYYGGGDLCHLHAYDDVIDAKSFCKVTGFEV